MDAVYLYVLRSRFLGTPAAVAAATAAAAPGATQDRVQ